MSFDFDTAEDVDGVRLTWNTFPAKQFDAVRCVVPIALMYTPLKGREQMPVVNEPVMPCNLCKAILNPFCQHDQGAWTCCFCGARNQMHPQVAQLGIPPYAVQPEALTIEYPIAANAQQRNTPPVFMFVVDVVNDEENMEALRQLLVLAINLLPPDALVGLVTFGKHVSVYELGGEGVHSYVFHGGKEHGLSVVNKTLGLIGADERNRKVAANRYAANINPRFFQPVEAVEEKLSDMFEQLRGDGFPVAKASRALRCTGAAINVAQHLVGNCATKTGAHVVVLAGGPCTVGPGRVVVPELRVPIRSHHELHEGGHAAKELAKARQFYERVARHAVEAGHAVDLFVGSYDQVGLYEMDLLADKTGGVVVLSDAFSTEIFRQLFARFLGKSDDGYLDMGLNASLDVKVSPHLKISGLIGHAGLLNVKLPLVLETAVGIGGTHAWKLCHVLPHSTYTVLFEVSGTPAPAAVGPPGLHSYAYIQYITHYEHPLGEKRLRVTTVARPVAGSADALVSHGFDQECAAVVVARMAVQKLVGGTDASDVIVWLDKTLVELCGRFAEYTKGDPLLFRLAQQFLLFPQFMYHMRRLQFCQVFNNSPDETMFYRHMLFAEDTNNLLVMIQPTLTGFEVGWEEPQPVLLDLQLIAPERILLLDTFFHILIFYGLAAAQWREDGLAELEEYAYLADFFAEPRKEAVELLQDRFPLPRFVVCDEGGLQARFLMSKLNPTSSYSQGQGGLQAGGAVVLTDDVSLQVFMEHVQKQTVQ